MCVWHAFRKICQPMKPSPKSWQGHPSSQVSSWSLVTSAAHHCFPVGYIHFPVFTEVDSSTVHTSVPLAAFILFRHFEIKSYFECISRLFLLLLVPVYHVPPLLGLFPASGYCRQNIQGHLYTLPVGTRFCLFGISIQEWSGWVAFQSYTYFWTSCQTILQCGSTLPHPSSLVSSSCTPSAAPGHFPTRSLQQRWGPGPCCSCLHFLQMDRGKHRSRC